MAPALAENGLLGLPFPGSQAEQEFIKQNQAKLKDLTPEEIVTMLKVFSTLFFLMVDAVFSLPVWVAMLKVSGLQRMRDTLGKKP